MPEFSKFRLITVAIILMFIFVVAAIYTNTKDAANNIKNQEQEIKINEIPQQEEEAVQEISETEKQLQNLMERIDYLEKKVAQPPEPQQTAQTQGVRCDIKGIIVNNRIVPLSAQDAVNESKNNGNDVLIVCNFSYNQ